MAKPKDESVLVEGRYDFKRVDAASALVRKWVAGKASVGTVATALMDLTPQELGLCSSASRVSLQKLEELAVAGAAQHQLFT